MTALDHQNPQGAAQAVTAHGATASRGNTAMEYSLVGASILVATVGLWFLLGGSLKDIFSVIKADMQVRGMLSGFSGMIQGLDQLTDVRSTDGRTIDTGFEFGAPTTQTVGTSGNTAEAYKNLRKLSENAVAEGKMTQEEAANLDALAQQALKLAGIQKAIETAMAQVGLDNKALLAMQVQLEGESYTVAELADMIGWKENTSGDGNPLVPDANANGAELNILKELYQEALASGALKDPGVQELVSQLTGQVANFSDVSQNASDGVVVEAPEAAQQQYEEGVAEQLGDGTTSTSGPSQQAGSGIAGANSGRGK